MMMTMSSCSDSQTFETESSERPKKKRRRGMIPSRRCLREGCEKYNQTGLGGYCATHKGERRGAGASGTIIVASGPEDDKRKTQRQRQQHQQRQTTPPLANCDDEGRREERVDPGEEDGHCRSHETQKKRYGMSPGAPVPPGQHCRREGRTNRRRGRHGGYRRGRESTADAAARDGGASDHHRPVIEKRGGSGGRRKTAGVAGGSATNSNDGNGEKMERYRPSNAMSLGPSRCCLFEGCTKWKQRGCNGYCCTHKGGACRQKSAVVERGGYDASNVMSLNPSRCCMYEGCTQWRRQGCNNYCYTHREGRNPGPKPPRKGPAASQRCKYQGCPKWRQGTLGGFCVAHKNNARPREKARLGGRDRSTDRCKYEGCTKWRQGAFGGYCSTHKNEHVIAKDDDDDDDDGGSDSDDDDNRPNGTNRGSTSRPTREVLDRMRAMSTAQQRDGVAEGQRVKVRFEDNIWYGGIISCVMNGGGPNSWLIHRRSRIKISFDDGTEEEAEFPDCDIVIDDFRNGRHTVDALAFVPSKKEALSSLDHDSCEDASVGEASEAVRNGADGVDSSADEEQDEDSQVNACLHESWEARSEYDMTDQFGSVCQPCDKNDGSRDDDDASTTKRGDSLIDERDEEAKETDSSDAKTSPFADDNNSPIKNVELEKEDISNEKESPANVNAKGLDALSSKLDNIAKKTIDGLKEEGCLPTIANSSSPVSNDAALSNNSPSPAATTSNNPDPKKMEEKDSLGDKKCNNNNSFRKSDQTEKEGVTSNKEDSSRENDGSSTFSSSVFLLMRIMSELSLSCKRDDSSEGENVEVDSSAAKTISLADDDNPPNKAIQSVKEDTSNVKGSTVNAKCHDALSPKLDNLANKTNNGLKENGCLSTVGNSSSTASNDVALSNSSSSFVATTSDNPDPKKMKEKVYLGDKCNNEKSIGKCDQSEKEGDISKEDYAYQKNVASPTTRVKIASSQNVKRDDSSNGENNNSMDRNTYDSDEEEELGAFIYRSSLTAKSLVEQSHDADENPATVAGSSKQVRQAAPNLTREISAQSARL